MIDILNSICRQIASKFKNPIHIDNLPQKFIRPSFYIELLNNRDTELTSSSQERQMTFQITYFGTKDEMNNVSTLELYSVWSVMEKLFYRTLMISENDYKKIESIEHFIKDGSLIITLRLNFDYQIEQDNPLIPEEVYDLMKKLNMKYNQIRTDLIN